jgi:hypothetical protein
LVRADRQTVWDAWRDANQYVWGKLTEEWQANESVLRQFIDEARERIASRDPQAARQAIARFFDALKSREAKQESINAMKAEADALRKQADEVQEKRVVEKQVSQQAQAVPVIDTWRAQVERSREALSRFEEEVAELEKAYRESDSLLDQAMVRGTLVEKKRRLSEHQRNIRVLEQRIDQAEQTPLMTAG